MLAIEGGVNGYEAIDAPFTILHWGGLEFNSNSSSLLDGSVNHGNWFYAVGVKNLWKGAFPGPFAAESVQQVELYALTPGKA